MPLEKVSVRIYSADLEYVRKHFPDNYNATIRRALHTWCEEDARMREIQAELFARSRYAKNPKTKKSA